MSLRTLPFNINFQSGLELHCEVVFPDGDLLEPAFYQCFVEFSKVSALLLDVVLQVVNSCNLRISGSGVIGAFFTLFAELENLVGYLVVGSLLLSFLRSSFWSSIRCSSIPSAVAFPASLMTLAMFCCSCA